jgi:CheY-like chemotaxis protein
MDHSYRQGQGSENGSRPQNGRGGGGGQGRQGGGRMGRMGRGRIPAPPKFFQHPDVEPLPVREDAATKIYAFVDDLFFSAKIQETARKLNIKVEFVKTDKELFEKLGANGDGNPSLIIFDLNNANAKPLTIIPKLKAKLKKETAIIGFLSHLQSDLKMKATEAGADMVLPRSAFSQNLPQLLRRNAVEDDVEELNEKGM